MFNILVKQYNMMYKVRLVRCSTDQLFTLVKWTLCNKRSTYWSVNSNQTQELGTWLNVKLTLLSGSINSQEG